MEADKLLDAVLRPPEANLEDRVNTWIQEGMAILKQIDKRQDDVEGEAGRLAELRTRIEESLDTMRQSQVT